MVRTSSLAVLLTVFLFGTAARGEEGAPRPQTVDGLIAQLGDADTTKVTLALARLIDLSREKKAPPARVDKIHRVIRELFKPGGIPTEKMIVVFKVLVEKAERSFYPDIVLLACRGDASLFEPAVEALKKSKNGKDTSVDDQFIAIFQDVKNPVSVRVRAIRALNHLSSFRAVPPLIQARGDAVTEIALAAQRSLEGICTYPFAWSAADWKTWWAENRELEGIDIVRKASMRKTQESCDLIDPKDLDANLRALKLSKPVREKALENIARLRQPAAIDPLLAFIEHEPYWNLRARAMKILAGLAKTKGARENKKDAEIATAIIRFLERETDVRMVRVEVEVLGDIGRIEGLNLVKPLIPFLGTTDPEVRAGAASSLGKIDGPEATAAVEPLCGLLDNAEETANTKRHAANALGLIRDARAVPTLVKALSDPDPNIRWSSANSLRSIGDKGASGALVKRLAIEKEDRVLDVIVKALHALKSPEAAKPLADLALRKPDLAAGALGAIVNIGETDLDALRKASAILKEGGGAALVLELLKRFTATPAGKDAGVRMDYAACLEEQGNWEEATGVYAHLAAERPEIEAANKGLLRSLELISDPKAKGKVTARVMSLLPGRARELWAGPVRQAARGPKRMEGALAEGLIEGWSGAQPDDAFFRGLVAYVTHADNSTASAAHRLLRAWTGRKVAPLPENANRPLKEQALKAWQTWYAVNKNAFPFLKK